MLARAVDRWSDEALDFASVSAFEGAALSNGAVHTIAYGRGMIDLLINTQHGLPLVVCLNGAVANRESKVPPFFSGSNVLADCNVSTLFINDPGVYLTESMGLAWYAGWDGVSLQDDLCRIIRKVATDSSATGIAIMGGSGGGFASMALSAKLPGSLALAWNPQTDLFRYNRNFVEAYTSAAWGSKVDEEVIARMSGQASHEVISTYATPRDNYVLYLQNRTDWHVRGHLLPLLNMMGVDEVASKQISDGFYLEIGEYGEGHAAPSKDYLKELLPAVLNDARWIRLFSDEGIGGVIPAGRS